MKWEITVLLATMVLSLPTGHGLQCYSCLFPTVSPLKCLKFQLACPPGQRCSSTVASGRRGDFQFVLHDRGCTLASLCDRSGMRTIMGTNFTYHTACCDTDLCNSAVRSRSSLCTQLVTATLALAVASFPGW